MKPFYVVLLSIVLLSCSKEDSQNNEIGSDWVVNEEDISGVLSLFPLALNPEFTSIDNINLSDVELAGIVKFGSEIRVYPYAYVNQNEVINDVHNGQKFAFSYCPITKSAIAFETNGVFRASGYLYKENLTPWDEETESIWSQMLLKGIRGPNKNQRFNTLPVLETNIGTVRNYFPNAKIMVFQSASNRTSLPPDGDESDDGNAPQNGDLVYGILDDLNGIQIFNYKDFGNPEVIKTRIGSQDYVTYGNESKHVINAFKVPNYDNYQILENEFPYIIKDNNGVKFDIFGKGTNGTNLQNPERAYVANWWAWDDFFDTFTFHN